MQAIRHLLAQRHFAVLICLATLLLKVLVPTGYMIGSDHGRITITICSGTAPRTMTLEVFGTHGDIPDHGKAKDHVEAEMPCAFSSLSAASLGAVDPVQLAALIVFVMRAGLAGQAPPPPLRRAQLRPPPRGPPAYL